MNRVIFILTFIVFAGCKSTESNRLLFIGNSLTYYNDMPDMLVDMLAESKVNLKIESSTYPGFSLKSHLNTINDQGDGGMMYTRPKKDGETTATEKLLLRNKYQFVILQERSGLMLLPDIVINEVTKSVSTLEKLIGKDSQILFYQNYPLNAEYPKVICRVVNSKEHCTDTIDSEIQEMELISKGYELLKKEKDLVKIGDLFTFIMINEKNINLFADEVHPSMEGSFLIALKFYKDITGKRCSNLIYRNNLDIETSDKLKEIVDKL